MKLNKSVEQAVYVLLLLALQKDHRPLKSQVLSQNLQVSDSYLKKILIKISHADLVQASASKQGGYQLAKPIDQISLKDVYFALDQQTKTITFSHLSKALFAEPEHIKESEQKIVQTLLAGEEAFYERLDELKLASLLHKEAYTTGVIDWEKRFE